MLDWRTLWWSPFLLATLANGCGSTVDIPPGTSTAEVGGSGAAEAGNGGSAFGGSGGGAFGGSGGGGTAGGPDGGGTLGGSGGAGGSGGRVGGTGGTTAAACDPARCPAPSEECKIAACSADDTCTVENVPDGQVLLQQADGDCKQNICQGGVATAVSDDTDIEDDGQDCTADTCEAGQPSHAPLTAGACDQMGGQVCDSGGSGLCVTCNFDADCANEPDGKIYCDPTHACVAPDCLDGAHNGAETDMDCGGPVCAGCDVGLMCDVNADCLSGLCDGGLCAQRPLGAPCRTAGACASGHCVDGVCCDDACSGTCESCRLAIKGAGIDGLCGPVSAGTDPDSDCPQQSAATCGTTGLCDGAAGCQRYPAGTVCQGASCSGPTSLDPPDVCDGNGTCVASAAVDCQPYLCASGSCYPGCLADSVCAPGYYCLAPQCVPKKMLGQPCAQATECQSGSCADGVCCDSACSGTCESCLAAIKGAGLDGLCEPVSAGTDPDNDCPQQSVVTCGTTGLCNGSGACQLFPPGTICKPTMCVYDGDSVLNADYCNGLGVCVDGGIQNCAPLGCLNGMCALKGGGQPCLSNASCLSNLCVDGVCCNNVCVGTCQACSTAKTGATNGVCANIPANTDPDNECPAECDGQGGCGAPTGFPCSQASQCESGFCADGVCCDSACNGACKSCNQASSFGICSNVPNGQIDTCQAGQACLNGACQ